MQLNWSTFLLEVVNFLVLVWILKRFLYKPVLVAIAQRKAAIDKTLVDAEAKYQEAHALELQYQNRLADWEGEKEGLRTALSEELRVQRERLTADLQKSLEKEREKELVLAERRMQELEDRAAEQGIQRGVQFTARLLERIATPEIEARLVALTIEDLPHLPSVNLKSLQAAWQDSRRSIKVASAFPLNEAQCTAVLQALREATHESATVEFEKDSSLMAGLRLSVGPWTVRANLRDELQFFAEMTNKDVRKP